MYSWISLSGSVDSRKNIARREDCHGVVHLGAQENNSIQKEARINVVLTLTARRLLDHDRIGNVATLGFKRIEAALNCAREANEVRGGLSRRELFERMT